MLKLTNVTKSFNISSTRSVSILHDINISFPDNGLFFIVGKSGCGKSTLLNIISGLLKADSGTILFDDLSIDKISENEKEQVLRDDISILFQYYNLISDISILDNLEIASSIKNVTNDKAINLLKTYGLYEKRDQLVDLLSGGEKQRVALIRSIINKPKVLLCDEPTGALDADNEKVVLDMLKEISRDTLIIVVTHNDRLVNLYGDGVVKLENGTIVQNTISIKNQHSTRKKILKDITKSNKKYIDKMVSRNIRKNCKTGVLSAFSTVFSLCAIVLSLFFNDGLNNSRDELLSTYADVNTFSISKIKNENIQNSHLTLLKYERPTFTEVYNLIDNTKCYLDLSYDYLFDENKEIKHGINFENKIVEFKIKPILNLDLNDDECIVNSLLYEKLFHDKYLNEIILNSHATISYIAEDNEEKITEKININVPLKVKKIANEFEYMNVPTLYYQTTLLEKLTKDISLKCVGEGGYYTLYDLIDGSSNNSDLSNNSLNIFALNNDYNEFFYKNIKENSKYIFKNEPFTIVDSFLTIGDTVFKSAYIFIAFICFTSFCISSFLAYSTIDNSRKESAILSTLGASNSGINNIFIYENLFYLLMGLITGIGVSTFSKWGINTILFDFTKIENVISFDWLAIVFIMLVYILITLVFITVPLIFFKKKNFSEELKEE